MPKNKKKKSIKPSLEKLMQIQKSIEIGGQFESVPDSVGNLQVWKPFNKKP